MKVGGDGGIKPIGELHQFPDILKSKVHRVFDQANQVARSAPGCQLRNISKQTARKKRLRLRLHTIENSAI
jgi:hypothetical protein